MSRRPTAWKRLRDLLVRLGRWSSRGRDERRTVAVREQFWTDAREGEREAAARARD
jgi:hypothetical protein